MLAGLSLAKRASMGSAGAAVALAAGFAAGAGFGALDGLAGLAACEPANSPTGTARMAAITR
jgi:hypothetical protein